MDVLEKELEDGTNKDADKEKKASKDGDDKEHKGRITSYNVCYTKLLRLS